MLAVVLLLVFAPVYAELVSTYLDETGDIGFALFLVAFLAPLYGGAALVIREVALRTGRGWPGRLILATAFGVAMPTLVDVSLFTPESDDVAYWDDIMTSALVADVSMYAVVSWVAGHVLMSIAAPLAIVEGLFPDIRAERWIGTPALVAFGAAGLGIAVLIRMDEETHRATPAQTLASVAVVLVIAAAAFAPWGRPVEIIAARAVPSPLRVMIYGVVLMLAFDLAPISWLGVAVAVAAFVTGAVLLLLWAHSALWSWRHIAAFGYGVVLARSMIAFLAPLPNGVEPAAKYAQNFVLLGLTLALGAVLRRRIRRA